MIQVEGLRKCYRDFEAVRGVSFSVGKGRVVGLLGPNGAGKTSIMKVLTGFHRPSEGTAVLNGLNVDDDPVGVKSAVGYLPEGVPLYTEMTIGEYLAFVSEARGLPVQARKAAVAKAMEACGIAGMSDILIEHLSKGYRQRVGLAQAIVHEPPILILDEPTTGLDPNQILEIRSLIRSLGAEKTVILSTHILQEVEALCSEVLILHEGRIVAQGSTAEIAKGMKGEERLSCTIHSASAMALGALERARSFRIQSLSPVATAVASGTRVRLALRADSGEGDMAAEELFDWAVANGAKLLELKRESLSLEEIFVKLTTEETKA
ncbi:MAG: MFS transporter [Spirochaetes bacterium RIFOXYC1_FULL_54_7]|nr:MAG: MFS transporter [Spirochaetes bacterium RIFOXYC1_FULL_54_7]